ncbi:MAG: thioesterase family protein [Cyclobacteriaceae bacterium]|nr:thioesterase family protein [Cyclobacteriaceae bacterium]
MKEILTGTSLELTELVTVDKSASAIGSGLLEVYSTPSMIALMEKTAFHCLEQFLQDHESSVGGEVNIRHLKPTAIGQTVRCTAVITAATEKKVTFEVRVFENDALIGKGTHTRFVIDKEAFKKVLSTT